MGKRFCLLGVFWLVIMLQPAWGQQETFFIISAPMVKHMLDNKSGVVINVLSDLEYGLQHISGSINIPVNQVETTDKLPKDKSTPLVFYCMGKR